MDNKSSYEIAKLAVLPLKTCGVPMLLDPFSLFCGATAITAYTGGALQTFGRLADGKYVGSSLGTLDEPQFLDITNRMNYNGSSTITIKTRQQKNVAAINGVPQKDDEMGYSSQIILPHRSFSSLNVVDHMIRHAAIVNSSALAQILLGQR